MNVVEATSLEEFFRNPMNMRPSGLLLSSAFEEDDSILILAVKKKNNPAVAAILYAGIDLDWLNSKGCSALIIATHNGDTIAMELLIDAGANINMLCISDKTHPLITVFVHS